MSPDTIKGAAREAGDHPALEMAARIGYAVSGLLHLLIGWIALQVAWGSSGKSADQSGALASLAGNGVGRFGLWVAVHRVPRAGHLAARRGRRRLLRRGHGRLGRPGQGGRQGRGLPRPGGGAPWASPGASSPAAASRASTSPRAMLHSTGGRVLVVVIGLVVIGVGGYHVYKGATKRFLRDLAENPGTCGHPGRADRLHRQGHRPGHRRPALRRGRGAPAGPRRQRARRRAAHPARPALGRRCSSSWRSAWRRTASTASPRALREGLTTAPAVGHCHHGWQDKVDRFADHIPVSS